MRVLVTGLTGFLGSHLGRLLVSKGADVYAIVRPGSSTVRVDDYLARVHTIEADLNDPASYRERLHELRPQRAFHLAWYVEPKRYWTAPQNLDCVVMTLQLARNLADVGCERVVATGTCAEYAWEHGYLHEERTPSSPRSLYGAAKNATRELLTAYGREVDTRFAWGRLFFPYGPGEPASRLIPSVTLDLLNGRRARCSHGRQIRDFVHAEDCASALWAIAEAGLSGTVNVGTGEPTRLRRVAEILAELTGRRPSDLDFGAVVAAPDDPPMVVADPSRLYGAGWQPAHTLESGLADAVAWLRKDT